MLRILSFIRDFLYLEFPLTEVPLYALENKMGMHRHTHLLEADFVCFDMAIK